MVPYSVHNVLILSTNRYNFSITKGNSVVIRGRGTQVLLYESEDNDDYFTIREGESLIIDSFNFNQDYIIFSASVGTVVEIIIQTRK
jgi:hypothetical protein